LFLYTFLSFITKLTRYSGEVLDLPFDYKFILFLRMKDSKLKIYNQPKPSFCLACLFTYWL